MTLGALAVTSNAVHRAAAGVPLAHTTALPFECDLRELDRLLESGPPSARPAAVIVETVQGEGGVNVASRDWLRGLAERCRGSDVVLIVDDVQMGCGRTGPFFSFETAGIKPDVVCLSKSISGYGLPLAITLIRPDLDVWQPGEHSGTFRGFNLAFVTGAAALRTYWQDDVLERNTVAKGERIGAALSRLTESVPGVAVRERGRGLIRGLAFERPELARSVCSAAFELGLLVEAAGASDEVVKLMPPLTVTDAEIDEGLALLAEAVQSVR
jgi:diaminobutyrate-2-oxoglutarate transaminase